MASFISSLESLEQRFNGSISRIGGSGKPTIIGRQLDESAGINAGRVVAPSGTVNLECQEPTSAALVQKAYGFSIFNPMKTDADTTDGSPHYADQVEAWREVRLVPMRYDWGRIAREAETVQRLSPA